MRARLIGAQRAPATGLGQVVLGQDLVAYIARIPAGEVLHETGVLPVLLAS